MRLENTVRAMFEYQPPAVLNRVGPVQNDYYDILPETKYVRVYRIAVNVEDTNEDLQVQAFVDGETIAPLTLGATHSTSYYGTLIASGIGRLDYITLVPINPNLSFVLEGQSVQIQIRKTTNAGVGNLTGIVVYGILKSI